MDPDLLALGGRDAYEILGVPPDASEAEIRRARRARQFETHPDRHGDAELSKLVNYAAQILLNSERRRRYDEHRRGSPMDPPPDTDGRSADEGAWHGSTAGFNPHPPMAGYAPPAAYPTAMYPPQPLSYPHSSAAIPPMPAPYRTGAAARSGSVPTGLIVVLVLLAVMVLMVCSVCLMPALLA